MPITRNITLLPGDLLLYDSPDLFGRLVGWATKGKGEAPTYATHVGGIGEGGGLASATRIEALWTVKEFSASGLVKRRVQVWRMRGLSGRQRMALAAYTRWHVGDKYGLLKLVAHFGDALLAKTLGGHPYFFRRLCSMDDYPICSWLWACAYDEVLGYSFGLPASAAAPDDMHDHVKKHPEQWQQVA